MEPAVFASYLKEDQKLTALKNCRIAITRKQLMKNQTSVPFYFPAEAFVLPDCFIIMENGCSKTRDLPCRMNRIINQRSKSTLPAFQAEAACKTDIQTVCNHEPHFSCSTVHRERHIEKMMKNPPTESQTFPFHTSIRMELHRTESKKPF